MDFSIDFRTLANHSHWGPEALVAVYLHSLADYLKDELVSHAPPTSLDEAIALTARIDRRVQARRRERGRPSHPSASLSSGVGPGPGSSSPPGGRQPSPEPMEVGRASLSAAERRRRLTENLCLYCGGGGHRVSSCPGRKRASSADDGGVRLSSAFSSPPSTLARTLIQARLFASGTTHTQAALIDSGAEANIMDGGLAQKLGLKLHRLPSPVPARALGGHLLGSVSHITEPVGMVLSSNHQERVQFHLLLSPSQPLILGHPWLRHHNPNIDWRTGEVREWGVECHQRCLLAATPSLRPGPPVPPPDLSTVPACYLSLGKVFSKAKA